MNNLKRDWLSLTSEGRMAIRLVLLTLTVLALALITEIVLNAN